MLEGPHSDEEGDMGSLAQRMAAVDDMHLEAADSADCHLLREEGIDSSDG